MSLRDTRRTAALETRSGKGTGATPSEPASTEYVNDPDESISPATARRDETSVSQEPGVPKPRTPHPPKPQSHCAENETPKESDVALADNGGMAATMVNVPSGGACMTAT